MNDGIVNLFDARFAKSSYKDAIALVKSFMYHIPPPSLMQKIIYHMLMTKCDASLVTQICDYFENVLAILPDSDDYNFREIIEDGEGHFSNLFIVFTYLINSSFHHYGLECDDFDFGRPYVQYPNCDYLVYFYTQIIMKCIALNDNPFKDDEIEERYNLFYQWLNRFYKSGKLGAPIVRDLHNLLDKLVTSEAGRRSLSDSAMFNLKQIEDIGVELCSKCPDMCMEVNNLRMFMRHSRLSCLKASVCRAVLYNLTSCSKTAHSTFTLKTLVVDFLCCQPKSKPTPSKKKRATINPEFVKSRTDGNNKLQNFCRCNEFGSVIELLMRTEMNTPGDLVEMLNHKNCDGVTALHLVALVGTTFAVKNLCDAYKGKIDLKPIDNQGRTPMHYAVSQGNEDVIKYLIGREGTDQLLDKDHNGLRPSNYADEKTLTFLVQYMGGATDSDSGDSDLGFDDPQIPSIRDKADYPLYCLGLRCLLELYREMRGPFEGKDVMKHGEQLCYHFRSSDGVCSVDASVWKSLPEYVGKFTQRVLTDISAHENAVVELIRLTDGLHF